MFGEHPDRILSTLGQGDIVAQPGTDTAHRTPHTRRESIGRRGSGIPGVGGAGRNLPLIGAHLPLNGADSWHK